MNTPPPNAESKPVSSGSISYDGLAPAQDLPDNEFTHEEGHFTATTDLIPPAFFEKLERDEELRRDDDTKLYWQQWEREAGETHGIVTLMHGYGEHSARFRHVAGALARAGFCTVALDARGHGRSSGHRGHIDQFSDYVLDFAEFVERVRRRFGRMPLYVLGHSNGGLIVLRYALCANDSTHVSAWSVTSPFCGFPGDVPAVKAAAGKMLSRIWPTLSLATNIDPSDLSHIERVAETYAEDPLVFEQATARWFTETIAAQEEIARRAAEIYAPFLFLLAGEDRIVDAKSAQELFHRLGSSDRELEIFSDMYHELLNETKWTEVCDRIISWYKRHTPADNEDESGRAR